MIPTVTLCNYAQTPLGCTIPQLAAALQAYCNDYLAPEWGCGCTVKYLDPPPPAAQLDAALAGSWALILLDTTTQADAEGYHLEGTDGEPRGFAFLETTAQAGDSLTVTVSHEFAELLCDPLTSLCVEGSTAGRFWILEVCDAVEESDFLVNGISMSNFVTRQWYNSTPPAGTTKFDYLGHLRAPFTLEAGGYISWWTSRTGWSQSYGSKKAEKHFASCKQHRYSRHSRRAAKHPHQHEAVS